MNHNIIFGENLHSGANYKETLLNHNKMISFANQNFFFYSQKETGFCKGLGSVVLRPENAILGINHYPTDKC